MKIIQFSDLHLFANPARRLLNVNTRQSFQAVVRLAMKQDWPPDMVLLTGDLSQDGSPASYRNLVRVLERWDVPVYCLPGNHDNVAIMKRHLRGRNIYQVRQLLHGRWNLLFLDSTIKGSNDGNLRASEMTFLKKNLKNYSKHHVFISFHHSPFKLRSEWLDTMKIKNGEKFLGLVEKNKAVSAVVFGHVHQAIVQYKKGVLYTGAPSTCVQFKPRNKKFKLDSAAPGYQVIELESDGSARVRVKRIKRGRFKPDLASKGY